MPDHDLEAALARAEPAYRSRGEAQVGRCLARYGITYRYEWPKVVEDGAALRTLYPDFTLPRHGDLLVEYLGMLDRPEYWRRAMQKHQIYRANELPVLYVLPEDLRGPAWDQRLVDRIRSSWRYRQVPRGYRLRPRYG